MVVVSLSKSISTHSNRGGSSITRAFEIFGALLTEPGITLEIDVARPRNLNLFKLLDFSHLFVLSSLLASLFKYLREDEEETYLLYLSYTRTFTQPWRGK